MTTERTGCAGSSVDPACSRDSRRFRFSVEPRGSWMTTSTITPKRAARARVANKKSLSVLADIGTSSADSIKAARAAIEVCTDPSRDALLTDFGRATLIDRYLLPGEST